MLLCMHDFALSHVVHPTLKHRSRDNCIHLPIDGSRDNMCTGTLQYFFTFKHPDNRVSKDRNLNVNGQKLLFSPDDYISEHLLPCTEDLILHENGANGAHGLASSCSYAYIASSQKTSTKERK